MLRDNHNPLIGDGLGPLTEAEVYIDSIRVIASGDTWQVILQDNDGNVIFESASDIANDRKDGHPFPKPFYTNGINITTWTDMSKVYVYVAHKG